MKKMCEMVSGITPISDDFVPVAFNTISGETFRTRVHTVDQDNEDILKRLYELESGCLPAMIAKKEGKNVWWVVNDSVEES